MKASRKVEKQLPAVDEPDSTLLAAAMLLLVDIQPAFLTDVRPSGEAVVGGANEALRFAKALDVPTVAVRTEHTRDESSWSLNMRDDGKGFSFEGTSEAQFDSRLELDHRTIPLLKRRDSAFFDTDLDNLISRFDTTQLWLGGLMASSCIMHTARDATERNLRVTLLTDSIGDTSSRKKHQALKALEQDLRQPSRSSHDLRKLHPTAAAPH